MNCLGKFRRWLYPEEISEIDTQTGMTLIEMMMGVGLFAIVALFGMKILDVVRITTSIQEADEEVLQARTEIMNLVNCNSTVSRNDGTVLAGLPVDACTFDINTCPLKSPRYMAIKSKIHDSNGVPRDLVPLFDPANPTKQTKNYKRIMLRAQCICCQECTSGKGVLIEYSAEKTKVWDTWKPLFGRSKPSSGISSGTTASTPVSQGLSLGCVIP
jgi:prepilin-type N-terminal cleavage/methylation domain-containing protein